MILYSILKEEDFGKDLTFRENVIKHYQIKCLNEKYKYNSHDSCPYTNAFRIYDVCFYIIKKQFLNLESAEKFCKNKNLTLFSEAPLNNIIIFEFINIIKKIINFDLQFLQTSFKNLIENSTGKIKYLGPRNLLKSYFEFFFYYYPDEVNLQIFFLLNVQFFKIKLIIKKSIRFNSHKYLDNMKCIQISSNDRGFRSFPECLVNFPGITCFSVPSNIRIYFIKFSYLFIYLHFLYSKYKESIVDFKNQRF